MTDKEILHAYGKGTTDYSRNKIVMQSENFVVIRTPGHNDWSGVGSRDYYPSHTVLIRKGEWCLASEGQGREEWEGRVSNKILKTRMQSAELRGMVERKVHQRKDPTRLQRGIR